MRETSGTGGKRATRVCLVYLVRETDGTSRKCAKRVYQVYSVCLVYLVGEDGEYGLSGSSVGFPVRLRDKRDKPERPDKPERRARALGCVRACSLFSSLTNGFSQIGGAGSKE